MIYKAKIGIDARFVTQRPLRGIGNYSLCLINRLIALEPNIQFVLYIQKPDYNNNLPNGSNVKIKRLRLPTYLLWENVALPICAYLDRIDILHCLGNTAPFFTPPRMKVVLTLHDVMFLLGKSEFQPPRTIKQKLGRIYRSIFSVRAARKSNSIITISKYSRSDILRMIPSLTSDSIEVIYIALPDKSPTVSSIESYGEYYLALGAADPRKNTSGVIDSFLLMLEDRSFKANLVVCGYVPFANDPIRIRLVQANALGRVYFLPYVADDELSELYRKAISFLYVSFYEGFGLPLLESFSFGCPVIASATTCIPEIAGSAVLYVDPHEPSSIAAAMKKLYSSRSMRAELISRGYTRLSKFSWNNTAINTLNVYRKLINE